MGVLMKRKLLALTVTLSAVTVLTGTGSVLAEVKNPATELSVEVREKLTSVGLSIQHIEPSPLKGIFTVVSKEGVSYVDSTGNYIFTGSLFRVNGKKVENTTEQTVLNGVRNFAANTRTITYKSPKEKYVLGIFTDITCGFCQRLHHDINDYLNAGITIKYLAFPRAGVNSVVADNMAKIWCATDPSKSLTQAMNDARLPDGRPIAECQELMRSHYQIASTIPLQGTPTLVTLSGKPQLFTGWVSPENIVKKMSD